MIELQEDGFVPLKFFGKTFGEQLAFYRNTLSIFLPPFPKVELLHSPLVEDVSKILAYSAEYSAQIQHTVGNTYASKVLEGLAIPAGMEMLKFVFGIKGCSRVFTHQMVRHRQASVSQSNSRDRILPPVFILPFSEEEVNKKVAREFKENCNDAYDAYIRLMGEYSIEPQDARYILPDSIIQSMVFSIDFRSLQHLCSQRLCLNMQPETSFVAWSMKFLIQKRYGVELSRMLRPTCDKIKSCLPIQCNVYDSCGKWPSGKVSKTGKKPISHTSDGWSAIREYFFQEEP